MAEKKAGKKENKKEKIISQSDLNKVNANNNNNKKGRNNKNGYIHVPYSSFLRKRFEKPIEEVNLWQYEVKSEYKKGLRAKTFDISTGALLVCVLDDEDALDMGVKALERVQVINKKNNKKAIAVVDISREMVSRGNIGLFRDITKALNASDGNEIEIKAIPRPESAKIIKKKLNNIELSEDEIRKIVKDIQDDVLDDLEIASFITGVYIHGFTLNETVAMTKSILSAGKTVEFKKSPIVDKHSIGGINGRATMLVVPIVAANGLYMPKTSSRAITSPCGTADAMEVLAPVDLPLEKIKKITEKTGGVVAWGGTSDLAPVDDKIIKIENPLNLDPQGQVIASVMSKKASVGSKYLVIDLPLGPEMKVTNDEQAKEMALKFIQVGKELGIKVSAIVTDGSQPSGRAFGPALEAKYVMEILEGKFFDNLAEKACILAGAILELAGKAKQGTGYEAARKTLESGKALEKFQEIIKTQGGKIQKSEEIKLGRFKQEIKMSEAGKIAYLNIKLLRELAKISGAPGDKRAGVVMELVKGQRVDKGELLLTIYGENQRKVELAKEFASKNPVYEMEKVELSKFY